MSQTAFMATLTGALVVAAALVWWYMFATSAEQPTFRRTITLGIWRPGDYGWLRRHHGRRGVKDGDGRLRMHELPDRPRGYLERSVTAVLADATATMAGGAWRTREAQQREQRMRWEDRRRADAKLRAVMESSPEARALVVADALTPRPVEPTETDGATEEWSPLAEIETVGRSTMDWWSARVQEFDATLRWIERAPRLEDGAMSYVVEPDRDLTAAAELERFVAGSMRLHAYRELRIGATGEFTAREHMELEAMLVAA